LSPTSFTDALRSPEPLVSAWARFRLRVIAALATGADDPLDQAHPLNLIFPEPARD
jgi:hypothetical protein